MPYIILPYIILPYIILPYIILPYIILPYIILPTRNATIRHSTGCTLFAGIRYPKRTVVLSPRTRSG